MGKITTPKLSWSLFFLGLGLTSAFALGTGGIVYLQLGLPEAKNAWLITFSIVSALAMAFSVFKLMQKRSARYYYLGIAIVLIQFSSLLYLFLVPVFFTIAIASLPAYVIICVAFIVICANTYLARDHFLKQWTLVNSDLTIVMAGVRGISVKKFTNAPDMSNAPSSYNFEPQWISTGLAIGAVIAMVLGFNFRNVFPDASMIAIGCAVVYVGGYFSQGLVVLFYKIRIIRDLEKKYGQSLVAMDFGD